MTDFREIFDFVQQSAGLTFPASRQNGVAKVFTEAMTESGFTGASQFVDALRTDAALRDAVVAKLTIGETYFFRDPAQFDVIRNLILPDVLASRDGDIRIWSAASASGEEAYSMAIVLEELGASARARIIATDIARPRLASAQRGRYKKWSLRGVPDATVQQYFTESAGTFELAPRLRERVTFKYLNLAEDSYPSLGLGIYDMDLIVCRNVLIYFDEQTVRRVAQRLMASLSRTGWLLVGASDPPISHLVDCDVITTPAGLAYRRRGEGGEAAIASHPETDRSSRSTTDAQVLERAALDAVARLSKMYADDDARASAAELDTPRVLVPRDATSSSARSDIAPDASEDAASAAERIRALCNRGETREAAAQAIIALDANGDSAELHYLLAVALTHEDRVAEAMASARRALYLDRKLIIGHVLLGQLHARAQDRSAAVRSFSNALDLLDTMHADAIVDATDGERAGRIREAVAMHIRLLKAAA